MASADEARDKIKLEGSNFNFLMPTSYRIYGPKKHSNPCWDEEGLQYKEMKKSLSCLRILSITTFLHSIFPQDYLILRFVFRVLWKAAKIWVCFWGSKPEISLSCREAFSWLWAPLLGASVFLMIFNHSLVLFIRWEPGESLTQLAQRRQGY